MDNRKKAAVALQIVSAAAVPVIAFLLRMLDGDTRNEHEEVISRWLISKIKRGNHGAD